MKVVTFRHTISDGMGSPEDVLRRAGADITFVDTYKDDISGFDALTPDLLIVMGGPPGVYQQDVYPFLTQEIRILERRLAAGLPVIGICLGAQLMAAALGARVYKGAPGTELGWVPLSLTPAGEKSAARHFAAPGMRVMQWHNDTFDMPKSTTLLASSSMYENQIFTYGENAIAFQCHVEVTPQILEGWFVSSARSVAEGKLDLKTLRADTKLYGPQLIKKTEIFLNEWAEKTFSSGKARRHA